MSNTPNPETHPDIAEALSKQVARELAAARLERRTADVELLPRPAGVLAAEATRDFGAGFIIDTLGTMATGWKVGCSSERAMAALGTTEPFTGQLFEALSHDSGATVPVRAGGTNVAEPEFAFTMGKTLAPKPNGYSEDEVAAAVDMVHPAIEIVDPRVPGGFKADVLWLIADGGVSHAFILGEGKRDWKPEELAKQMVSVSKNGVGAGEGTGAAVLGGPLKSLTWLVNHLGSRAKTLLAGQVVTTGLITPIIGGVLGDRFEADFGPYGKVAVTYGA